MVEQLREWHAIMALEQYIRSNERCRVLHVIIKHGQHIQSDEIGHGISSLPFDKTHDRKTLVVA